jgi:hypothetical protein
MDIKPVIHILIIPIKVAFGAMQKGIEQYTIRKTFIRQASYYPKRLNG